MSGRIGGWVVNASASAAIATAEKDAVANKQHVIYALDVSFSATPAAPVRVELLSSSASPGTSLYVGYVLAARTILFPEGLCVAQNTAVAAVLSSGGAVIGEINMHGVTR
jgi:hypothetical protein